jgi:hypothetical protein
MQVTSDLLPALWLTGTTVNLCGPQIPIPLPTSLPVPHLLLLPCESTNFPACRVQRGTPTAWSLCRGHQAAELTAAPWQVMRWLGVVVMQGGWTGSWKVRGPWEEWQHSGSPCHIISGGAWCGNKRGPSALISYLICILINFNLQFNSNLMEFSISEEGPWPSLACT